MKNREYGVRCVDGCVAVVQMVANASAVEDGATTYAVVQSGALIGLGHALRHANTIEKTKYTMQVARVVVTALL
jgi:hypothetical protein